MPFVSIDHLSQTSQILLREFDMSAPAAIHYAERVAQRSQFSNATMAAEYAQCEKELSTFDPDAHQVAV